VDGQSYEKVGISSPVKTLKLNVVHTWTRPSFQIDRLGLHETMSPCLVYRPRGTGDYLFMLFHSTARIESRGKNSPWPASTLMIWKPQDGHFYGNAGAPWNHSWIHCSGRDISQILKTSRLPVGKPFSIPDPSLMESYLLDTVTELNSWHKPDEIILRNLFENFIRVLSRHFFDKIERFVPDRLLEIKRYLGENFSKKLRLSDLARQAGWSVPHLCTEFKRFYGVPIIQYIQQLRMNQSIYLLRDHNRNISEIAGLVGYPDLYTFSKMFKRCIGLSPRNFRQINHRVS